MHVLWTAVSTNALRFVGMSITSMYVSALKKKKGDMVSNEQIKRKWEEKLKTEKPERIQEEKEGRREKTISQIRCLGLMTLGPHGRQGGKALCEIWWIQRLITSRLAARCLHTHMHSHEKNLKKKKLSEKLTAQRFCLLGNWIGGFLSACVSPFHRRCRFLSLLSGPILVLLVHCFQSRVNTSLWTPQPAPLLWPWTICLADFDKLNQLDIWQ